MTRAAPPSRPFVRKFQVEIQTALCYTKLK